MVKVVGFNRQEQDVIHAMMERFDANNHRLSELTHIAKADMPGYNGKVIPKFVGTSERFDMTMYLASCGPFTLAHELAHVTDITVRRQETLANITYAMPAHWHLAHRMTSEYYANRVACAYSGEPHIFEAFQSDSNGMKKAVLEKDWASFLIYYSLLLGIMHGMDRMEIDPIKLLNAAHVLPDSVLAGIDNFKRQAIDFFDSHAVPALAA